MSDPSDKRPTWAEVKKVIMGHGFTLEREAIFEENPLFTNVFRGKSVDGKNVCAHVPIDYADEERVEPEITSNICRGLELDRAKLDFDCGDGHHVSMNPIPNDPDSEPPPLPN